VAGTLVNVDLLMECVNFVGVDRTACAFVESAGEFAPGVTTGSKNVVGRSGAGDSDGSNDSFDEVFKVLSVESKLKVMSALVG